MRTAHDQRDRDHPRIHAHHMLQPVDEHGARFQDLVDRVARVLETAR